jgi:hypothetical protein
MVYFLEGVLDMKFDVDENGYITGWDRYAEGGDSEEQLEEICDIPPDDNRAEKLRDEYGNPQYRRVNGEAALSPQEPTPEQVEKLKKQKMQDEVAREIMAKFPDHHWIREFGTATEKAQLEAEINDARNRAEQKFGLKG